jgi:serine phosphatase RsbU (regulator of sigma subunit)/pSer/pThr/pTyr-binding forkhead associated (FHA) protein
VASLVPLNGPRKGQRLQLKSDRNTIGRNPRCEIVLNDHLPPDDKGKKEKRDSISRKHAIITRVDREYFIEDGDGDGKKSRNGTFLNGDKIDFPNRVQLRHLDKIGLCDLRLQFLDDVNEVVNIETSLSQETSVTSLKTQSAEKLQVVLELSNSLSSTFDVNEMLPKVTQGLFKLFEHADRCFVITTDVPSGQWNVLVKTRSDEDDADACYSNTIVRQCMENGEAILGSDLPDQFPNSESVIEMNARSLMCAPLWSIDRKSIGAIQLDTQKSGTKFTADDLKLLLGVASQVSIALNSAQMHQDLLVHRERERELEMAHEVQRALLPQSLPDVPAYEFYAHYEAAQEVGGDYYDFVPLPKNRLAVLLGDVAGKGISAALLMAKFGVEARVCLEQEADLASAMKTLNARIARSIPPDRFVTIVALVLDLSKNVATVVNAGHLPPLLVRHAEGRVEEIGTRATAGLPIGVSESSNYATSEVPFAVGDQLVVFSDGITEAMNENEQLFGLGGVMNVVEATKGKRAHRDIGPRLIEAVRRHSDGCRQNDDITLLTLTRR